MADKTFQIVEVSGDWFRLIPSRFPPVDIYQRIAANDRWPEIAKVEDLTNPRLQARTRITGTSEAGDTPSPQLQNWNHAPFTYPNPEGTHYFCNTVLCLELSDSLQTALAASVRRREAFLSQTGESAIGLDMRVLKVPVTGRFVDLRQEPLDLSRKDRWLLGDALVEAGVDGAIFMSPDRPTTTCLGVLTNKVLGHSIQTKHYRFVWDGARISKLYAFEDEKELMAEQLKGEGDIIAA